MPAETACLHQPTLPTNDTSHTSATSKKRVLPDWACPPSSSGAFPASGPAVASTKKVARGGNEEENAGTIEKARVTRKTRGPLSLETQMENVRRAIQLLEEKVLEPACVQWRLYDYDGQRQDIEDALASFCLPDSVLMDHLTLDDILSPLRVYLGIHVSPNEKENSLHFYDPALLHRDLGAALACMCRLRHLTTDEENDE